MVERHSDSPEIIEAGTFAHIFGFWVWVDTDRIENASDTIETLSRLSDSLDRLYLGDRGTAVETILKETGENLLRTNRLDLLERLFDVLQAGLSEGRVDSVCTDLIMTADELLREDEIDMDTYTRVAKLCQD
jgi:hypothetical protein